MIDEFQELFVEDDKLAQDAALLLDRLVRQGRAFGIHVLLGSQTLSGAYSLARSTMGQMAVRVALQCSEADAHLILSDERNDGGPVLEPARRGDLQRPERPAWPAIIRSKSCGCRSRSGSSTCGRLKRRAERAGSLGPERARTIVFEGDQPADPADNVQLREVLERGPSAVRQRAAKGLARRGRGDQGADCGDVRPPRRQQSAGRRRVGGIGAGRADECGGRAGGAESAGAGAGAGVRCSRQLLAPRSLRFYVLDGTRPESPEAGTWQRIADALPHKIEVGGPRDTARIISELAAELARREAAGDEDAPPMYLVIFNGGRFRDLRRGEDDFSFSIDRDKPPSPDKQWAEILRNGPAWGIHTLLWCDSYNNVNRMLDRMALREFEMRVAFQMSAADSSSLLDNPAATRSANTAACSPAKTSARWKNSGRTACRRTLGLPKSAAIVQLILEVVR